MATLWLMLHYVVFDSCYHIQVETFMTHINEMSTFL